MAHKGAWLVVFCSFLAHFLLSNTSYPLIQIQTMQFNVGVSASQGIAFLFYPLVGLLTDIFFTRYKIIVASTIIQIITCVFGALLAIVWILLVVFENTNLNSSERILAPVAVIFFVAMVVGVGMFEANAIQFGMDQLLEEPTETISSFIHWYYLSTGVGVALISLPITGFLSIITNNCTIISIPVSSDHAMRHIVAPLTMIGALLQLAMAIVSFHMLLCCKKHLTIEPAGYNPFTTVCKVLKYACQHKCPENRSAFTYWEEDIPRRIDLGKNKYGGPFTTEEVEDTKTFFRILLLLVSLFGFHLSGNGFTVTRQLMHQLCPSSWLLLLLTTSPPLLDTLTALAFTIMLHFIFLPYLRRFVPNLLKRLGVGLILAFLTELTGILITCSTVKYAQSDCCYEKNCKPESDVENCYKSKFYFNVNGTCNQTDSHAHNYDENCVDHTFALILIPQLLRSLSSLFVFMTALEFICAQAPLRMKGLLIGIWYATSAVQHLVMFPIDEYFYKYTTASWLIFHGVRGFFILVSILLYCYVAKHYRYRQRDEVVNEQFLIEEIYERQLLQAEQYERERQPNSASCNADIYGSFQNETLLN